MFGPLVWNVLVDFFYQDSIPSSKFVIVCRGCKVGPCILHVCLNLRHSFG